MADPLSIIGGLITALGNVQSASVLKEHVSILRTQLDLVKERIETLEEKNAHLVRRNAELEQKVARQENIEQFVEAGGALFKHLAGGGYADTPYCPVCQSAMWAMGPFPFECGNQSCKQLASFGQDKLKDVLSHLPPP